MDLSDKISAVLLVVLMVGVCGWWFGKVIPERDAKLFAIHDCYVEQGCQTMGVPGHDEAASECWQMCTVEVREQHENINENHEAGVAAH
tara:strand:- start:6931 stop:7197 length:267 start_codon:yes stop_codon:yes gene_type:complete